MVIRFELRLRQFNVDTIIIMRLKNNEYDIQRTLLRCRHQSSKKHYLNNNFLKLKISINSTKSILRNIQHFDVQQHSLTTITKFVLK